MKYHLLEKCGIEIEYMLVDSDSLDIAPIADQVLLNLGVDAKGNLDRGEFTWSNEVTKHVLELKTTHPVSDFHGLHQRMNTEILWMEDALQSYHVRLLPTGMHPWMDPSEDTDIYPLAHQELYASYRELFDWSGHGWGNIQATHLNFSFGSDVEFVQLHSAVRLLLPLLPALCASSPIVDGDLNGDLDNRLKYYRQPTHRLPSLIGEMIPEAIESREEYDEVIYDPIRKTMDEFDPKHILSVDVLNARGAVARFDRSSLEIRVIDSQECPRADIAIAEFVREAVRWLIAHNKRHRGAADVSELLLAQIYHAAVHRGMKADFVHEDLLPLYGMKETETDLHGVLRHLAHKIDLSRESREVIELILRDGNLSSRIIASLRNSSCGSIEEIYRRLADCLTDNEIFFPIDEVIPWSRPRPEGDEKREPPTNGSRACLEVYA